MFIALVNWDKCTGCGSCVAACPVGCFKMTGDKSEPHLSTNCIDCGNCMELCQDKAITISIGWGGYKWPAQRFQG